MATIKKRESGRHQAVIRREGYPQQSKTFPTKADAERWARLIESEMDRGVYLSTSLAEHTTFDELAARFETEFAMHHYRGKAWNYKLAQLRVKLGEYSLAIITPQTVAKYRDDRLQEPDSRYKRDPAKAPRVAPATVKGEIDLLSKVLDVASKEFGIPLPGGNPVHSIRKPKGSKSRDRRLTPDEWDALMHECRSSQNRWLAPAVIIAVETAMRQGELLQLQWKNIDKQRRLALLLDTEKIKTEEPRAVPLSTGALDAMECLPRDLGGRVVPIDRHTLYGAFEAACKRTGIENYRWHDLRHEALSRLAERGDWSALEMAAVSGHKTIQMLKRYTHLQAEKLAKKMG